MNGNKRCLDERAKKLEYQYVHNVYSSQALSYDGLCDGPWPEIKNFLFSLRTGSFVADVVCNVTGQNNAIQHVRAHNGARWREQLTTTQGHFGSSFTSLVYIPVEMNDHPGCGNGKYLAVRNDIVVHGVDICQELSQLAYERQKNIIIANNLNLPYRPSTMDAVISVGVVHHFASFERRLQSVKELARILKPGGQVLIYVWAWEQKQRKFSSQDVLIPWTLENEKREGINGFGGHDIQANNINKRRTYFKTNGCLEEQSVTNENEDSRFNVGIETNTREYVSNVDGDQLSDNEKQQGNSSLINYINNFTAELKEKLQSFSFSKGRKLQSDDGRKFDESDSNQYYQCQTNCNSNGLVASVKDSEVLSVKSKQKLDKTKQHKNRSLCDNAISEYNGGRINERINDSICCNENGESSRSQVGRFKRFYHVFIKDELSELVQSVRSLNVLTQYYDHGNWVVKAEKRKDPE